MKSITFLLCFVVTMLVLSACASSPPDSAAAVSAEPPSAETPATDALTGMWSGDWGPTATHRNDVMLDLKWDGAQLTGTVNPGPSAIQLTKATFDKATGAIMMEAEARGHDGKMAHYMIEGKVEGESMMGSWNHDQQKGDFKITKK